MADLFNCSSNSTASVILNQSTVITSSTPQKELTNPPKDSVSVVKFPPGSDRHLLVSSWDGTLRMFNLQHDLVNFIHQNDHPILACTTMELGKAFFGGLDDTVSMIDFVTEQVSILGTHEDAVKCMDYSDIAGSGIIISGSWDSTVKLFDPRTFGEIGKFHQPDEVYCLSAREELLVVATAQKHIVIWDLRSMKRPLIKRCSAMPKHQSRCISISPDKQIFAMGSASGRTSIEHIQPNKASDYFAFRSNVSKELEDGSFVYHPVNAVCQDMNFVTGGSDGIVSIWDPNIRQKIQTYSPYSNEIAALDFSDNGRLLAIGCSYLHDKECDNLNSLESNRIFIRQVKCGGNPSASNICDFSSFL